MVVNRSRTSALGYRDFTFGGSELEEIKESRILGVTFDSKLTFENQLRGVISMAARNLGVVRRAGKLFDYLHMPKGCFNAYVLSSLEFCAPVRMSSAESHWDLLDSIVCSAERLCEGEFAVWGAEGRLGPCVCSMRFITEWTTE